MSGKNNKTSIPPEDSEFNLNGDFPSIQQLHSSHAQSSSSKKRVSFQKGERIVLSERSLRDPLSLDAEAPQHVPIKLPSKAKTGQEKSYEKFLGIEFDDDTDYLQFMKSNPEENEAEQPGFMTIEDVHNMQLGKDLMGDYVDPEVAFMLEDQFDEDKNEFVNDKYEVVQTMKDLENENDDAEDDINDLMDDLMNGPSEENNDDDLAETEENTRIMDWMSGETSMPKFKSNLKQRNIMQIPEDQEIDDFDGSENLNEFDDRRTTFTQYSMSSSVMKRSEHLTQIDDTFESVVETLYQDEDMGDLEFEAEDIHLVSEEANESAVYRLLKIHDDQVQENIPIHGEQMDPEEELKEALVRKTLELQSRQKDVGDDYDPGEDLIKEMEKNKEPKPQYDCESILSTKSNLFNRPKFVDESKTLLKNQKNQRVMSKIQLNKMGLPMGPGASFKQLKKAEKRMDMNNNNENSDNDSVGNCGDSGDNMSQMTSLTVLLSEASVRNKNETPAERKQRKQLVKELRKARREERKNTRTAFREEGIKQAKADINRSRDTAIRL